MRLLLRADASGAIGAGHVARMVAVAEHARARGWAVSFSGTVTNAEWLAQRFTELGVTRVAPGEPGVLARQADAVLVDHYELGELREQVNRAGTLLVSIEDGAFGRREADIVIDPGLAVSARPADGSGVVVAGPRYAPLRQAVRHARERRLARPATPGAPRVVVVLGGGGTWQDTATKILRALRDTGAAFAVDVLALGEPELPDPLPGQGFSRMPPDTELPRRLGEADLVVSAAGVTLLELCCIGVPAALVCLVDNQASGYRAAVDGGLAAGLGDIADLSGAVKVLRSLLGDAASRDQLAATAARVVDGHGADRILDTLWAYRRGD